jgi:hypothetical protein
MTIARTGPRRIMGPSILALGAQFLQIVLGLISVPLLLHSLGSERFSALSILWALPSLAPLVDLGLPRALSALLVQRRQGEPDRQRPLLLAAVLIQVVVLVALAALAIACSKASPALADLQILSRLQGEVQSGSSILGRFLLASSILSIVNIFGAFLQARGDLYLLLSVTAFTSLTVSAVPLTALVRPPTLSELGSFTVGVRTAALLLAVGLVLHASRASRERISLSATIAAARDLLRSGSRALTYFAISPLLVFGERYLVPIAGGGLSIAPHLIAVDLALRFLIVPSIIAQYSFKEISDAAGQSRKFDAAWKAYSRLMTWLFVLPLLGAICFSKDLLALWLGSSRVTAGSLVCVQTVLVAVTTCAVSSFLVQTALITNVMGRLSALAALELVVYPLAVLALLYSRPASFDLPVVLSVAWSIRVMVESLAMLRLMRDMFSSSNLARVALAFVALPATGAVLVDVADRSMASIAGVAKVLVFIILGGWLARLIVFYRERTDDRY